MTPSLGKLQRVDLRDVWKTEAQDFTPWLARETNLSTLGETLDIDLELISTEKKVGDFSADITCTNTADGSDVLIENQLERTDHTHLGQLLTYAASLHALSIVWIAAKFKDEHRAALDWLNEITDPKFRFFGLEVELWRIGESLAAPKFNIVSKPNDWTRTVNRSARRTQQGELTKIQSLQLEYWQSLRAFGEEQGCRLRFQSPRAQHWYNFGIGKTDTKLVALVNSKTSKIIVGFESFGETGTAYFDLLYEDKELIENALGFALDWHRLDGKKMSAIWHSHDGNLQDREHWPELHKWMVDHLERFDAVFRPRVKEIDPSEWVEPDKDEET